MGVNFFQNGVSLGASAGWGGYTGGNNYVVRYDFTTDAAGASAVTLTLSGIYNGHEAGTQRFGFKIGSSGTAWANARAMAADSGLAAMSYNAASGYGCTLTATGLNLAPHTTYYIFVFVASAGAEYYTAWNCTAPGIALSGVYVPPSSAISSVSAQVSTGSAVSIIMNRSGGCWHRARFYYSGELLAESEAFAAALSHTCPRAWLSKAPGEKSVRIDVAVQSYAESACTSATGAPQTAHFTLTADEDMRPALTAAAVTATAVNTGAAASFTEAIAGVSRVTVSFNTAKIDLSACAGATAEYYSVSVDGRKIISAQPTLDVGVLGAGSTLLCTVTDSRGREGGVSMSVDMLPYVKPSLGELAAERCSASGEHDEGGAYIRVRAALSVTAIGAKNSATVYAAVQPSGGEWGAETTLTAFESGKWSSAWATPTYLGGDLTGDSYTVRLRVCDAVGGEGVYTLRLYHQQWAVKLNENGTAIGFGMAPTAANAVMVASTWRLYMGTPVLAEGAYGTAEPTQAVSAPVEGQLYFKLKE